MCTRMAFQATGATTSSDQSSPIACIAGWCARHHKKVCNAAVASPPLVDPGLDLPWRASESERTRLRTPVLKLSHASPYVGVPCRWMVHSRCPGSQRPGPRTWSQRQPEEKQGAGRVRDVVLMARDFDMTQPLLCLTLSRSVPSWVEMMPRTSASTFSLSCGRIERGRLRACSGRLLASIGCTGAALRLPRWRG